MHRATNHTWRTSRRRLNRPARRRRSGETSGPRPNSGWDLSSRWLADGETLATIRTLALLPPDLNSLLVHLEETLATAYQQSGNAELANLYTERAQDRADAVRRLMWDAENGVFTDYLWREGRVTGNITAATLFPLFLGVSTAAQAQTVASIVSSKLLQAGGLATTLVNTGQQWDAPNGWAPLQWIAVMGLRDYGYSTLAEDIATRWVAGNILSISGRRSSSRNTT